jgi:hypothetical protein
MLTVSRVIEGASVAGDGSVLQPAATLSPEVRAQLFDEFATETTANTTGGDVGGTVMGRSDSAAISAVLLAIVLGVLTFFILRYVAKEKTN